MGHLFDIVAVKFYFIFHTGLRNCDALNHRDGPNELFTEEVPDLKTSATFNNVHVDRKMRVNRLHLVPESVTHTFDHIQNVRRHCTYSS